MNNQGVTVMTKLLLLDNEPEALEWLTAALSDDGDEVRGFLTGREALAGLDEWRPDLIIADVLMPEMDGFAFARLVRAHAGPPVMFISIAMKRAEAVLAGAVGYIEKPATATEVRAAVHEVLGHPHERATILVVDDDEDARTLFRQYLGSNFRVIEAIDGVDALERLQVHEVALIITDFHMPNMNGLELIRALRADPKFERTPVIVQTSDRVALSSPVWGELGVSYRIEKADFLRWLRRNIDASLNAAGEPDRSRSPAAKR
jgi:CheY-like chemotaxis protein